MRVLVVNHAHTQACGVYDLGVRVAARLGADYIETNDAEPLRRAEYDVALFNYHHSSIMPWVVPALPTLPGVKASILHDYTPATIGRDVQARLDEGFDRVVVLDPDIEPCIGRFLPERVDAKLPDDVIRVGSFGFAFPHKGFVDVAGEVVKLAAVVDRPVVYRLHATAAYFGESNPEAIATECRRALRDTPNVRLEFTSDHRSDAEIVEWLAGNHVNCLLYNMAGGMAWSGLSGALDYLLAARRPILVSESPMFRHGWGRVHRWPNTSLVQVFNDPSVETYISDLADHYDLTAAARLRLALS